MFAKYFQVRPQLDRFLFSKLLDEQKVAAVPGIAFGSDAAHASQLRLFDGKYPERVSTASSVLRSLKG